jgi:hypothetical protein
LSATWPTLHHFKVSYLGFGVLYLWYPVACLLSEHISDFKRLGEIYTAYSGSSLSFQHFLACHSHMDTKALLDTQVCLRKPPVGTPCTPLEWPAGNAEMTSHPWHSAV